VLLGAGASLVGGGASASPARISAAVRAALDAPPGVDFPLLPEVIPMPRAKLLLGLVGGLVVLGVGITTVVLLTKSNTPVAATTDGGTAGQPPPNATGPVTLSTRVVSNPMDGLKPIPAVERDTVWTAAFSPNGKWLVTAPNLTGPTAKVRVYDTATWQQAAVIDWEKLVRIPHSVAISDDGKRVFLTAVESDSGLKVWDVTAGRYEALKFESGGDNLRSLHLRLNPDGKTVACHVSDYSQINRIRVWNASTGEVVRTIDVYPTAQTAFTFTDGGKTLAVMCPDPTKPLGVLVKEWDVATGQEKRTFDLKAMADKDRGEPLGQCLAYTADGKQLVVGGGYTLPNPRQGFAGSGSVWVIDRESGKLVKMLIDGRHDIVRRLHLSADGTKLIIIPTLPNRLDLDFVGSSPSNDAEFVELQQWDAATWQRDWVKIVPVAERWRLTSGAK
jgi:WD40 repeat protein